MIIHELKIKKVIKILRSFLLVLLAIACNDNNESGTIAMNAVIPKNTQDKSPILEEFQKIYHQPNEIKALLKSGIFHLPQQGDHWVDGGIRALSNGEFLINSFRFDGDFPSNADYEIKAYIDKDYVSTLQESFVDEEGKRWRSVEVKTYGSEGSYNPYEDKNLSIFKCKKGQVLSIRGSGLTYLTGLVIRFKSNE